MCKLYTWITKRFGWSGQHNRVPNISVACPYTFFIYMSMSQCPFKHLHTCFSYLCKSASVRMQVFHMYKCVSLSLVYERAYRMNAYEMYCYFSSRDFKKPLKTHFNKLFLWFLFLPMFNFITFHHFICYLYLHFILMYFYLNYFIEMYLIAYY